MRQRRQLWRQAQLGESARDMPFPDARTLEALAETVRLAELEAQASGGRAEPGRGGVFAEGLLDALLFAAEVAGASGQALEHGFDLLALFVHHITALARLDVRTECQLAIDDRQVGIVVQETFAGGDLG